MAGAGPPAGPPESVPLSIVIGKGYKRSGPSQIWTPHGDGAVTLGQMRSFAVIAGRRGGSRIVSQHERNAAAVPARHGALPRLAAAVARVRGAVPATRP